MPVGMHDQQAYREARQHLDAGDTAAAADILIALAQGGTELVDAYTTLAGLATQQGDLEAAEQLMQIAVSKRPEPDDDTAKLAFLQAARGRHADALATLSPLLRTDPEHSAALNLVRELLGELKALPPVAWARLLVDLRTPPARHLNEVQGLKAQIAEMKLQGSALQARLHQLEQENARLRTELGLQQITAHPGADRTAQWSKIAALSDAQWQQVLLDSVRIPAYEGFPLPLFPAASLQEGMIGSSNEAALREGFRFYLAVRDLCSRHGSPLQADTRLLDFGTGWGRYARIFMGTVAPDHITGVDVDAGFIDICRNSFPYGDFRTVPAFPPSELPTGGFDLVIAYSVFSHLAPAAADAWIAEFVRLLGPGGIIAITTQGRTLLQVCEDIRQRASFEHPWHRNLARSFTDLPASEAAYDRGEFLYSATGGGDNREASFYGEALIPRGYVERHWLEAHGLELLEFIDDRAFLPQALIVLRKR